MTPLANAMFTCRGGHNDANNYCIRAHAGYNNALAYSKRTSISRRIYLVSRFCTWLEGTVMKKW